MQSMDRLPLAQSCEGRIMDMREVSAMTEASGLTDERAKTRRDEEATVRVVCRKN